VQALKRDYRVALVAGGRIDLAALNSFYGTSIGAGECECLQIPIPWPLATVAWGAALRGAFVARQTRHLLDRFDVLISSYNIANFRRPGIHLIADFSWTATPSRGPATFSNATVARVTRPLRNVYMALAKAVSTPALDCDFANLGSVLANSRWSREALRVGHGIDARVLYPPVAVAPNGIRGERKRRFICIGRISPEKRVERMITIMQAIRALGHDISLHIIGDTRTSAYGRKVERLCKTKGKWIVLEGRQCGERKARLLAESAFGIHARVDEAFGIAVAEMVVAGCVPFVPVDGGPAEIVGHSPELVYDSVDDAVSKIDCMLRHPQLESSTRALLAVRARAFSTESFVRGIRRAVGEFVASRGLDCPKSRHAGT
jgi:glycosyltransferase involved in cell wall biosynthesis